MSSAEIGAGHIISTEQIFINILISIVIQNHIFPIMPKLPKENGTIMIGIEP